jgi:hypothetical protein
MRILLKENKHRWRWASLIEYEEKTNRLTYVSFAISLVICSILYWLIGTWDIHELVVCLIIGVVWGISMWAIGSVGYKYIHWDIQRKHNVGKVICDREGCLPLDKCCYSYEVGSKLVEYYCNRCGRILGVE